MEDISLNVTVRETAGELTDPPDENWYTPGHSPEPIRRSSDVPTTLYFNIWVRDKAGNEAHKYFKVEWRTDCEDEGGDVSDDESGWSSGPEIERGGGASDPQPGDSRLLYWKMD